MNPKLVKQITGSEAGNYFCTVFHLDSSKLKQIPLHEGAANLVYRHKGDTTKYLRISYRQDRTPRMIATELDFVNYLAKNGFSCATPIPSAMGNLLETYQMQETLLTGVLFNEAKGKFIHQMQFQMPKGATLSKFWQKTGEILGKLHSLSSLYINSNVHRFTWLDRHEASLDSILPEPNEEYKSILQNTIELIRSIAPSTDSYGLCHNDFNIGNFKLDYSNSECDIQVFDFDDCGYNYFMYDLACVWELNTGWAYNLVEKEQYPEFMHRCFSTVLEGYCKHHNLHIDIETHLPIFLKAVHIENILESLRELQYAGKPPRLDKQMQYHFHCLQHDILYLGLFDDIFDAKRPFCL